MYRLDGKRIALLLNDSWQIHRILPLVGDMLKAEYPSMGIIPYEEVPIGNALTVRKKIVEIPSNWQQLLAQADRDLGCVDDVCLV